MTTTPVDEEAETTPGPDTVIGVLTFEQAVVTRPAGLLDGLTGRPVVVARINRGLVAAQTSRDQMLDAVIALDPEGAGADYADGMADTLDGYVDEIENLSEALRVDRLSRAGRAGLSNALVRSQATQAKVNAAFGGGE